MKRRDFLKALAVTPVVVAFPALAKPDIKDGSLSDWEHVTDASKLMDDADSSILSISCNGLVEGDIITIEGYTSHAGGLAKFRVTEINNSTASIRPANLFSGDMKNSLLSRKEAPYYRRFEKHNKWRRK